MRLVLFALLALTCVSFAQDETEGGNVTHLDIAGEGPSERWDGLFGEVATGVPANHSHIVLGNLGVRIDMLYPPLNCTPPPSALHIVAVNNSGLVLPLSPGSLALLDAFVGAPLEDGTATFDETAGLTLSYGSFPSVPSMRTYAGGAPSPYFRQYYLNDAAGNLVFVAGVASDRPDWNGTTSDYQLILPNNGSGINYTVWVDVDYTCPAVDEPGVSRRHVLVVRPPGVYSVQAGSDFMAEFVVANPGDYAEQNIHVTLQCPAGFSCGSGFIELLYRGDEALIVVPITAGAPGDYVLTVCAANLFASDCKDFIVRVAAECVLDGDCPAGQYCDSHMCGDKKPPFEPCERDGECGTGLCEGGMCVLCVQDQNCGDGEYCSAGSCIPVECPCGRVVGHACIPYECCSDEDCGYCTVCAGNACIQLEIDILVEGGELVEGGLVRVRVVDNLGRGAGGAGVFTDDERKQADGNGYASIVIPYSGLIFANFSCAQAGLMLDIIKEGVFLLPEWMTAGEEAEIQLVDSRGEPIAGAHVSADGKLYTTGPDGRFRAVFDAPGPKRLVGTRPGYRIQDDVAVVGLPDGLACRFPIYLGWLLFYPLSIWQLWALSIALAAANVWLLHRRISEARRWLWKLAYTLGPLALALPNQWLLAICFMSNIILLQFLAELVLWVKRRAEAGRGPGKKGRSYGFKEKAGGLAAGGGSLPEPGPSEESEDYEDTNDG